LKGYDDTTREFARSTLEVRRASLRSLSEK
jgi:hypothetical protein